MTNSDPITPPPGLDPEFWQAFTDWLVGKSEGIHLDTPRQLTAKRFERMTASLPTDPRWGAFADCTFEVSLVPWRVGFGRVACPRWSGARVLRTRLLDPEGIVTETVAQHWTITYPLGTPYGGLWFVKTWFGGPYPPQTEGSGRDPLAMHVRVEQADPLSAMKQAQQKLEARVADIAELLWKQLHPSPVAPGPETPP